MAVTVVNLASASYLDVSLPLSGVIRDDFVEYDVFDRRRRKAKCTVQMTKANFTKAADFMTDLLSCTSGLIGEVRYVQRFHDYSFNPGVECPVESNVQEVGHIVLVTPKGERTFSFPSVKDVLVGAHNMLIIDPGLTDNPTQNLIDEFTGRGTFNNASALIDGMWSQAHSDAYATTGRKYVRRTKR